MHDLFIAHLFSYLCGIFCRQNLRNKVTTSRKCSAYVNILRESLLTPSKLPRYLAFQTVERICKIRRQGMMFLFIRIGSFPPSGSTQVPQPSMSWMLFVHGRTTWSSILCFVASMLFMRLFRFYSPGISSLRIIRQNLPLASASSRA